MLLAGIHPAWQSEKNGTAVSIGSFKSGALHLVETHDNLRSLTDVQTRPERFPDVVGLAIDAPLIVWNSRGHRECEKKVGKAYGSRKASCQASNLTRYPDPAGVRLSMCRSKGASDDGQVPVCLNPGNPLGHQEQHDGVRHRRSRILRGGRKVTPAIPAATTPRLPSNHPSALPARPERWSAGRFSIRCGDCGWSE